MQNLANNFYLLSLLINRLGPKIKETTLVEVFRQNPREYVFQFAGETDHIALTFFCGGQDSFVFPGKKAKPREGSHLYFRELMGKEVLEAGVFENDRSFYLQFNDDYQLIFKLYGQHANVILFKNEVPQTMLRPKFQNDWQKQFRDYHNKIDQSYDAYERLLEEYGDPEKALKILLPALPKDAFTYLEKRGFFEVNPKMQWQLTQDLLHYLKYPTYFIDYQKVNNKNNPGYLLTVFESETSVKQFDHVEEAYEEFAKIYLKHFSILLYKNALLDRLKKREQQLAKKIKNNEVRLQKLVEGHDYKTLADILMANLHQLEKGNKEVSLYDFYNDQYVKIPLKQELSPQKNAERYYRKGRNQFYEIEQLEAQIENDQQAYAEVQEQLESIESTVDLKELKKEYKDVFEKPAKQKAKEAEPPFKHFKIKGYDIYVGKNAKSNDALTFKFANKNDLWLHAKDQHGSHVIVRNSGVDQFPRDLIEHAAAIAAYYSKGKGEEMCPVAYTKKKYVWKPKGSRPGQVHYKNEEVVLAEPGLEG